MATLSNCSTVKSCRLKESPKSVPTARYFPSGLQSTEKAVCAVCVIVCKSLIDASSKIPYGTVTPSLLAVALAASHPIILLHPSEPRSAKPAINESESVVESACVAFAIQRSKILPWPFALTKPATVFSNITSLFSPVESALQSCNTLVLEFNKSNPAFRLHRATTSSKQTLVHAESCTPVVLLLKLQLPTTLSETCSK